MAILKVTRWWERYNMNELIYQDIKQLFNVCLLQDVYNQVLSHCKYRNRETGGILIGNYSNDQKSANILQISGPPRNSKHFHNKFHRSILGLKELLDIAWEKGRYYVGEWHYHPNFSPNPSGTDIRQMITLSENQKLNCPEPILLIVGGNQCQWNISMHVIVNGEAEKLFIRHV